MNFEQNFSQPLDPNSQEYQSINEVNQIDPTETEKPVKIKQEKPITLKDMASMEGAPAKDKFTLSTPTTLLDKANAVPQQVKADTEEAIQVYNSSVKHSSDYLTALAQSIRDNANGNQTIQDAVTEFFPRQKELNDKGDAKARTEDSWNFFSHLGDIDTNDDTRNAWINSQYAPAYYSKAKNLTEEYNKSNFKDVLTPREFSGLRSLSYGKQSDFQDFSSKLQDPSIDQYEKDLIKAKIDKIGANIDINAGAKMIASGDKSGVELYNKGKDGFTNADKTIEQIQYDHPWDIGVIKDFTYNAIQRGLYTAETADMLNATANESGIDVERLAELQRLQQGAKSSKAYQDFVQNASLETFSKAPVEIILESTLESMVALFSHGASRMAAGAIEGGAAGSVIPGAGTALGMSYGFAAGTGMASLNLEYSSKILDVLSENGIDITSAKSLKDGFSNEKLMEQARESAFKKGIPVAIFDTISALIGGAFVTKSAKAIMTSTAPTLGRKILGGVAELATQSALGMAGEAIGQVVEKGNIYDTSSVIQEGIGEIFGSTHEIVTGGAFKMAQRDEPISIKTLVSVLAKDGKDFAFNNIDAHLGAGVLTQEQADSFKAQLDMVEGMANKLPKDMSVDAKASIIDLLSQRNKLISDAETLDDVFKKKANDKAKELDIKILDIYHQDQEKQKEYSDLLDRRREQYDVFQQLNKENPEFVFTETFDEFNKRIDGNPNYLSEVYDKAIPYKPKGLLSETEGGNKQTFIDYLTNKNPQYATQKSSGTQQTVSQQGSVSEHQGTEGKQTPTTNEANLSNSIIGSEAKVITADNLQQLDELPFTGVQKKVLGDVKNVVSAIGNIVNQETGTPLSVNLHTPETFQKAVIDAGGTAQDSQNRAFYMSDDGSIHLNMDNVSSDTMLHEGFHPILDFVAKNNPSVVDNLFTQLDNIKGAEDFVTNANEAYKEDGDITIKKEAITDFIAKVSDGSVNIDASNFDKIKAYLIEMLNKLGLNIEQDRILNLKDAQQLKDFATLISGKFSKGEEIKASELGQFTEVTPTAENPIAKSGQLQFSKTIYGQSGIEKIPALDQKQFQQDVKNGRISVTNPYQSLIGKHFGITFPDDLFTGEIKVNGETIGFGFGGVFYVAKYGKNGKAWAAAGKNSAHNFVIQANASLKKNGGEGIIVLSKGDDIKHATSLQAKVAFVNTLLKYAETQNQSEGIVKAIRNVYNLGNAKNPSTIISYFNNYLASGRMESGQTMFEAKGSFNNLMTQIIKEARPVVTKMFTDMGLKGEAYFDKTQLKKGNLLATTKGLSSIYADMLQEDFLKGAPKGGIYAAIKFNSELEYVIDKSHPSYPYVIQTKDGSPVKLEVFNKTFNAYGKDVATMGVERNTANAFGVVTTTKPNFQINPKMEGNASEHNLSEKLDSYKAIYEGKKSTPQFQKITWEKSKEGKGDPSISSRNEFVMQAANDLKNGKISNEEYRAVTSENSPIRPITRFFEPATKNEIFNALSSEKRAQINQPIENGKIVGLRLDIPAYKNNNTWVVSVHDGNTNSGKVLSYDNVAKITNVTFGVEPKGALAIASGTPKATIGRMFGEWQNIEGETLEAKGGNAKKMVEEIANSKEWVQVGMNPFRHSYFYDRSSDLGRPINSADEVIQVGGLVYAKNPKYGNWTDEAYSVKGLFDKNKKQVQFQKGIVPTGGVPSVPGENGIQKAGETVLPEKKVYEWEKGPEGEKPQPGETMIKTSTGRYVAIETMAGQQMDREKKLSEIEKAKPSFFTASYNWLKTALIDNQAMVLDALAKIGKQGQLVKAYLLTRNSASATASVLSENSIHEVYGDISKKKMFDINGAKISEYQLLNQMIGYQRVISIQQQMNDVYKNMIQALRDGDMNAYNINKQRLVDNNMLDSKGEYVGENIDTEFAMGQVTSTQAKALLNETRDAIGEDAFGKLMNSSKKYSDFMNSMLKSRMEAGLISEESYKYLSKFYYAPTRYISDILTDPILSLTKTTTSYSKEAILRVKSLAGGSEKLNISDYEGLLKAVTYASEYSIAENRATNRFYDLVSGNKEQFAKSGIRMGTNLIPITEDINKSNDIIDINNKMIIDGKKPSALELPSGQKQISYKGIQKTTNAIQKAGEMGVELYKAPIDIVTDESGNKFKLVQEPLKDGEDYIKTYVNGQRHDIIVPAWFAEQWYNKNIITSPVITNATSFISKYTGANFLRVVATGINPVFGIAQLIPDTISAYAATLEERKLPLLIDYPIFFTKTLLASKDIINKSNDFKEAMKYGATTNFYNGGMVSFEKGLLGQEDKSLEKVIESWNVPGLKQYIIGSKKITETTEQMSKVALYKSIRDSKIAQFIKDNGREPNLQEMDDIRIESGAMARGTADFHRKGVLGGELNKVIPYLNAGFQVQRAVLSSTKENPKKALYYFMEFAAYGTLLTLSALGMGDSDELKEKKRKAYLKLSDFDRDNRVILYYIESKDRFVSIKLPEFLVPIQSLQRRFVERHYLEGKELTNKDAWAIASNTADAIPATQFANLEKVASRNPAYSFIAKLKYNRDPYRQEEVVPYEKATKDYLEGAEAGKKRAGKIYQTIGKAAVGPILPEGISPKRLESASSSIPFQSNPFTGAILMALEWSTSDKELFNERYGADTRDKLLKASGITDRYMKEGSKINQNIVDLPMNNVKDRGEFKNTVAEMLIPRFDSAAVNMTRPEAFKKVRTEFVNNEYKNLSPEQQAVARTFIEGELKSMAKTETKDESVLQITKMAGSDAKIDGIIETLETIKVTNASKVKFIRDLFDAGLMDSEGDKKAMNIRGRQTLNSGGKNPYYEPKVGFIRDEILRYRKEPKKP